MAKNRKKVHRKIAVPFLFVGRFLRSIHQKTANYPRFTMRYRPERIRAAFGPYRRKPDFFDTPEVPKVAIDMTPPKCPKIETPNPKSETSPSLGQMHILYVPTDCLGSEKVCGNVGSESGYRLIVRFRSILERDLNCF